MISHSAVLLARAAVPESLARESHHSAARLNEPLALAPLLNKPMIAYTLDALADAGIERTAVVVERPVMSALDGALDSARARSTVAGLVEWDGGSVLTAISTARELIDDGPFALHLGDSINSRDITDRLAATHEFDGLDAVALMSRFNAPADNLNATRTATGRRADPSSTATGAYDAGVYLLGPGFPDELPRSDERRIKRQLATALDWMQERGGQIERRYVSDWWCYRGQEEPVLEMNRFALARLEDELCDATLIDSDLQGVVRADPSVCIESSVVRGPAVIGPNTVIKDAFLGPYSTIGADVRIEGAEVEHSVILGGSSISHLGGRLESSIIGPGAKVFRDFRLPKAMRLNVGAGANISLQ